MKKCTLPGFVLLLVLSACSVEPLANFEASTASVVSGETVDFTNTSLNATTYVWDFGDGSSSTDENPSHTWATGGSYPVSLTAYSKKEKKSDVFVSEIVIGKSPIELEAAKLIKSWSLDSLTLTKPGGPDYTFLLSQLWGGTNEYLYVFSSPNTIQSYRDGAEESAGTWELTSPTEILFDNSLTAPIVMLTEGKFAFQRPSSNDPDYTETLYFTAL